MATAEKILEIARSQIGTKESPANSDNVKYNTAYYGREVSGKYPWCAVFVWWVFREAGASDLYYGGDKTAYCPTLMSFHKKQKVTDYRPGDIVFFNFSGRAPPVMLASVRAGMGPTSPPLMATPAAPARTTAGR